jgi:multidrug efflux pump subunit AcrA (membrane-fusion protein)
MNRFFACLLLLLSQVVGLACPLWANPVVLNGKSYATKKMVMPWPFSLDDLEPEPLVQDNTLFLSLPTQTYAQKPEITSLGTDLPYLEIEKVNVHIGENVKAGQPLFVYKLPLINRINNKESFSTFKLDTLRSKLAKINFKLAKSELAQGEIKKSIDINTAATSKQKLALLNYESLLKERDSLNLAYELALKRYNDKTDIAKGVFGKDFDYHNYPKSNAIFSNYDGTVLWMNTNLVPGMIFTKKTQLIVVGNIDPIMVKAILYESNLKNVKVGDKVDVTFGILPDRVYHSKVETIHYVSQTNDPQVPVYYEVELYLENHDMAIKEGMRCKVAVLGASN